MTESTLCEFERRNGKLVCPRCDQPRLPGTATLPVRRVCRPRTQAAAFVRNDLARGPCRFRGPTLRTEACRLCGQRQKTVELFRCGCPERDGDAETSEERWRVDQLRSAACEGCRFYAPAAGDPA